VTVRVSPPESRLYVLVTSRVEALEVMISPKGAEVEVLVVPVEQEAADFAGSPDASGTRGLEGGFAGGGGPGGLEAGGTGAGPAAAFDSPRPGPAESSQLHVEPEDVAGLKELLDSDSFELAAKLGSEDYSSTFYRLAEDGRTFKAGEASQYPAAPALDGAPESFPADEEKPAATLGLAAAPPEGTPPEEFFGEEPPEGGQPVLSPEERSFLVSLEQNSDESAADEPAADEPGADEPGAGLVESYELAPDETVAGADASALARTKINLDEGFQAGARDQDEPEPGEESSPEPAGAVWVVPPDPSESQLIKVSQTKALLSQLPDIDFVPKANDDSRGDTSMAAPVFAAVPLSPAEYEAELPEDAGRADAGSEAAAPTGADGLDLEKFEHPSGPMSSAVTRATSAIEQWAVYGQELEIDDLLEEKGPDGPASGSAPAPTETFYCEPVEDAPGKTMAPVAAPAAKAPQAAPRAPAGREAAPDPEAAPAPLATAAKTGSSQEADKYIDAFADMVANLPPYDEDAGDGGAVSRPDDRESLAESLDKKRLAESVDPESLAEVVNQESLSDLVDQENREEAAESGSFETAEKSDDHSESDRDGLAAAGSEAPAGSETPTDTDLPADLEAFGHAEDYADLGGEGPAAPETSESSEISETSADLEAFGHEGDASETFETSETPAVSETPETPEISQSLEAPGSAETPAGSEYFALRADGLVDGALDELAREGAAAGNPSEGGTVSRDTVFSFDIGGPAPENAGPADADQAADALDAADGLDAADAFDAADALDAADGADSSSSPSSSADADGPVAADAWDQEMESLETSVGEVDGLGASDQAVQDDGYSAIEAAGEPESAPGDQSPDLGQNAGPDQGLEAPSSHGEPGEAIDEEASGEHQEEVLAERAGEESECSEELEHAETPEQAGAPGPAQGRAPAGEPIYQPREASWQAGFVDSGEPDELDEETPAVFDPPAGEDAYGELGALAEAASGDAAGGGDFLDTSDYDPVNDPASRRGDPEASASQTAVLDEPPDVAGATASVHFGSFAHADEPAEGAAGASEEPDPSRGPGFEAGGGDGGDDPGASLDLSAPLDPGGEPQIDTNIPPALPPQILYTPPKPVPKIVPPEASTAVIVNYLEDNEDSMLASQGQVGELAEEEDMDIDLMDMHYQEPVKFLAKPMVPVPKRLQ
jgi:hypothetical protein